MKNSLIVLIILTLFGTMTSQKLEVFKASNLNLSKSNINRLVYPANLLTPEKAQLFINELEKANLADEGAINYWVTSNLKKYNLSTDKVKQVFIFSGRQYADCTICKKNCKGRCVQDPGSDCVCMSHSEPNLREKQADKPIFYIYLSSSSMEENAAIDQISLTVAAYKANDGKGKDKDQ